MENLQPLRKEYFPEEHEISGNVQYTTQKTGHEIRALSIDIVE